MSKTLSDEEARRRVIEYVSGVQTGTVSHMKATDGIMLLIHKQTEAAEEEIKGLAIEVVEQFAYEPEDGVLTSGGLSTLETAFNILRRNGLLDKKGRYQSQEGDKTNE